MKKPKISKIFNLTWVTFLLIQIDLCSAQESGLTEAEKCPFEDLPEVPFATWKCEWRGPGGKCLPHCEEGFTLKKANKVSLNYLRFQNDAFTMTPLSRQFGLILFLRTSF